MQLEPPLLEEPAGQSEGSKKVFGRQSSDPQGRPCSTRCGLFGHILLHPDDAVSELVLVPAGHAVQPTPLPVVNVLTGQAVWVDVDEHGQRPG